MLPAIFTSPISYQFSTRVTVAPGISTSTFSDATVSGSIVFGRGSDQPGWEPGSTYITDQPNSNSPSPSTTNSPSSNNNNGNATTKTSNGDQDLPGWTIGLIVGIAVVFLVFAGFVWKLVARKYRRGRGNADNEGFDAGTFEITTRQDDNNDNENNNNFRGLTFFSRRARRNTTASSAASAAQELTENRDGNATWEQPLVVVRTGEDSSEV